MSYKSILGLCCVIFGCSPIDSVLDDSVSVNIRELICSSKTNDDAIEAVIASELYSGQVRHSDRITLLLKNGYSLIVYTDDGCRDVNLYDGNGKLIFTECGPRSDRLSY